MLHNVNNFLFTILFPSAIYAALKFQNEMSIYYSYY